MNNRGSSYYFCCPSCGAKLRVMERSARHGHKTTTDWAKVDWSKSTKSLAIKYGVHMVHISKMRARYAPETRKARYGGRR
jgi:hypothetical protein